MIQTRHRIPEAPLQENQILVYQVPIPEPLRFLEPRETETRRMHALAEYGLMHVKLYEDIAHHGHIATTYAYPVKVDGRYVMDPSPTPKFDNPKMDDCAGAAAVRRRPREAHLRDPAVHARWCRSISRIIRSSAIGIEAPCALCGADDTYLDEVVIDDRGGRMFVCSDTDYCEGRREAGHRGVQPEALA